MFCDAQYTSRCGNYPAIIPKGKLGKNALLTVMNDVFKSQLNKICKHL